MEVDNVVWVSSLHADGEGVCGVEGKGDEATRARRHRLADHTRVDLELQQTGVTSVKSNKKY